MPELENYLTELNEKFQPAYGIDRFANQPHSDGPTPFYENLWDGYLPVYPIQRDPILERVEVSMINHLSYDSYMNSVGFDGLESASEEDYCHSLYSQSSLLPSMIDHYSSQTDVSNEGQSQYNDPGSLGTEILEQPSQINITTFPCLVYAGLKNEAKEHPCKNETFSNPEFLLEHLRYKHIHLCCPACRKSRIQTDPAEMNPDDWKNIFFNSKEGVIQHFRSAHLRPWYCYSCGNNFGAKSKYNTHMTKHPDHNIPSRQHPKGYSSDGMAKMDQDLGKMNNTFEIEEYFRKHQNILFGV